MAYFPKIASPNRVRILPLVVAVLQHVTVNFTG